MGKIKTDMEKLVKGVRSAAAARHMSVRHVHKASHVLLAENAKERAKRARKIRVEAAALGTKLEHQASDRVKAAREMMAELGQASAERSAAVREAASRMGEHLEGLRAERGRMAGEMRESVQAEIGGIRTAVDTLRASVRTMMGGIGEDVAAATRLWGAKPSRMPARKK
jgi:hypothetical protein